MVAGKSFQKGFLFFDPILYRRRNSSLPEAFS
jgi:hypothetical protein